MTPPAPEKCVEILERWDRRFDSPERILADLIPIIESALLREIIEFDAGMDDGPYLEMFLKSFARERGLVESGGDD